MSNKILLLLLVIFHWFVLIGNISSIIPLIIYTKWYISLPLVSFLVRITFERDDLSCPLTRWENKIRKKLGWPIITGFVKHYVFKR